MNTGQGSNSGLNALTVDKAGNVYVSDSFLGIIWKTGPSGGTPTAFVTSDTLLPDAYDALTLVPPFGANGVEFNNEYTAMYVANTAYHSIVEIPVTLNPDGSVSVAGSAAVLTTGINAPDGIAVDSQDNLWVDANQGDEIVVIKLNAVTSQGPLAKSSPSAAIFAGSARTARSAAYSSRPVRHSVPTKNSSIPRTSLCFSRLGLPGTGGRFTMDARGQALPDHQDPRRHPAPLVSRQRRPVTVRQSWNHGRTAGVSSGMPRARAIR
jgi:SMP-30/Gluconolactonase/LRE-like region